jgi:hypothetical protein
VKDGFIFSLIFIDRSCLCILWCYMHCTSGLRLGLPSLFRICDLTLLIFSEVGQFQNAFITAVQLVQCKRPSKLGCLEDSKIVTWDHSDSGAFRRNGALLSPAPLFPTPSTSHAFLSAMTTPCTPSCCIHQIHYPPDRIELYDPSNDKYSLDLVGSSNGLLCLANMILSNERGLFVCSLEPFYSKSHNPSQA